MNGISPAGAQCRNRVVEWMATAMLLNFSITAFATPHTIEQGAFRYLLVIGLTPVVMQWSCLAAGLLRVVALYFNGRGLPWSTRVRAVCAIFGAVIFAHMALSLAFLTKDTKTWSLGVGTHVILALTEIYTCLRAGADINEDYRRGVID